MPFIINHIDNLLLAIELAIKVSRFILATAKIVAKVMHFTFLLVGGAVILAAYWGYQCYQHYRGLTTTFASIAEAEHGEVVKEFAPATEVTPEQFVANQIVSNPIDWELEADKQMAEAPTELPVTAPTMYQQLPINTLRKYAKGKIKGYMQMSKLQLADALLACV